MLGRECEVDVAALDWRDATAVRALRRGEGFDLVLGADVLYGAGDISPLVRCGAALLRPAPAGGRLLLGASAEFGELLPSFVAAADHVS